MPNIYLTGMMGSGKSVTGKRLATKLGYGFIDLDQVIEQKSGESIAKIFSEKGEPAFRDMEAQALKEAATSNLKVVATGGGTILRRVNVELMKTTGKIIFLETSPAALWERVKDKKDRPLLRNGKPQEKLMEIYATRASLYEDSCDLKVFTDGKTAGAVADEIMEKLKTPL